MSASIKNLISTHNPESQGSNPIQVGNSIF